MAITTREGKTQTTLAEINMIPFIDIVLVLLITVVPIVVVVLIVRSNRTPRPIITDDEDDIEPRQRR